MLELTRSPFWLATSVIWRIRGSLKLLFLVFEVWYSVSWVFALGRVFGIWIWGESVFALKILLARIFKTWKLKKNKTVLTGFANLYLFDGFCSNQNKKEFDYLGYVYLGYVY